MMPLALILVGLELQLLSWLVPDRTKEEEGRPESRYCRCSYEEGIGQE